MGKRGRPRHPDVLTPREWEVLSLLRENLTNEQIAERLGVTLHAARYHVSEILSKLGVATREEAAAWQPKKARAGPRWSIAFQIWLTAATAVVVIAVGVLAWGIARGSGDDAQTGAVTSTSPPSSQATSATGPPTPTFVASTRPPVGANVRAMQLVGIDTGIVLTDDALLRTVFVRSGEKILVGPPVDITPSGIAIADIKAVHFIDADHGWVVVPGPQDTAIGVFQFSVLRTIDGGHTWESSTLGPPVSSHFDASGSPVHIDFLNAETGWIVVRAVTGSSFDAGDLYRTDDGGVTWTRLSIPTGNSVYFADANNGWAAGGPIRDKLYVSHDGGATWNDASDITPLAQPAGPRAFSLPMAVDGGRRLLLPVTMTIPNNPSLFMLYSSTDEGDSWRQVALTAIGGDINAGIVAPSYVFAAGSVVLFALDGTGFQYVQGDSQFESFRPVQLGNIRDVFTLTGLFLIDSMDFLDRQQGWALAGDGGCERFKADCWQATFIEQTEDGGHTWSPLLMPGSTPTPFP